MERRYTSLRAIGSIYKVLGIAILIGVSLVVLAVALVSALGTRSAPAPVGTLNFLGPFATLIFAALLWLSGGLAGLGLYAFGEFISLMIAIEESTRATALYLKPSRDAERPGSQRQWLTGKG